MTLIKAKNVCKEWNGVVLFKEVSFEVAEGERILLFGRNGIGKTTLLKGLTGRHEFEAGSVYRGLPPEDWGVLDQQLEVAPEVSALDYVLSGSAAIPGLKRRLEELSRCMQEPEGGESVLAEYTEAYDQYLQLDGYGWEAQGREMPEAAQAGACCLASAVPLAERWAEDEGPVGSAARTTAEAAGSG